MQVERLLKKCAICGKEDNYLELISNYIHGASDLDLKPNGSMASLGSEIQMCPNCGYCNYDIEEHSQVSTSANFLGAQVFEWCNIPKSEYQNYLLEVRREFQSITPRSVIDKHGKFIEFDDAKDALLKYNILQYYRLFG